MWGARAFRRPCSTIHKSTSDTSPVSAGLACATCGKPLWASGKQTRFVQTTRGEAVKLTRTYGACPQCRVDFFPPLRGVRTLEGRVDTTWGGNAGAVSEWAEVKTLVMGQVTRNKRGEVCTQQISALSRLSCAWRFAEVALVETHRRGLERAAEVCSTHPGLCACSQRG